MRKKHPLTQANQLAEAERQLKHADSQAEYFRKLIIQKLGEKAVFEHEMKQGGKA